MQVEEIPFKSFLNDAEGKEGIVLLGAGGDPQEWIK